MSTYLYHASPEVNRPAIQRDGLVGPVGQWTYTVIQGVGVERNDPDYEHPIHLAQHDLREFVADLHDVEPDETDLWLVRVDGLALAPGWDGEGTYAGPHRIAADRLTLVTESDPRNLPEPLVHPLDRE